MALHVSLGGRPTMQTRVRVDEGQILTLLGREAWCSRRKRHQRVKCGSAARRSQRRCAVDRVFALSGDTVVGVAAAERLAVIAGAMRLMLTPRIRRAMSGYVG